MASDNFLSNIACLHKSTSLIYLNVGIKIVIFNVTFNKFAIAKSLKKHLKQNLIKKHK